MVIVFDRFLSTREIDWIVTISSKKCHKIDTTGVQRLILDRMSFCKDMKKERKPKALPYVSTAALILPISSTKCHTIDTNGVLWLHSCNINFQ